MFGQHLGKKKKTPSSAEKKNRTKRVMQLPRSLGTGGIGNIPITSESKSTGGEKIHFQEWLQDPREGGVAGNAHGTFWFLGSWGLIDRINPQVGRGACNVKKTA